MSRFDKVYRLTDDEQIEENVEINFSSKMAGYK